MIRYLGIHRLAVIDSLEVEFVPGLNVLTGETGAGKSVIVGAIALLAGARATGDLVRTGEQQALIQAIFEGPDGRETTVRRELTAQGRSRAFVDDVLASSAKLRTVTQSLVDLHGQHDHQLLLEPRYQLELLDVFGDLSDARRRTATAFGDSREQRRRLDEFLAARAAAADRLEFIRFQLAEIDKVAPRLGEDAELEAKRRVAANAERLHELTTDAYQRLYEGETAVLPELGRIWRAVGELASLDDTFAEHLAGRTEVQARLDDLAFALRNYSGGLDGAIMPLEDIESRLAALERLKRAHGGSLEFVLAKQQAFREELARLEDATGEQGRLVAAVDQSAREYRAAADELSSGRRHAAAILEKRLSAALRELAMPGARSEFRVIPNAGDESSWSATGVDEGELWLSANPGEDLRPLGRVASGGELSRIMLALKTLATMDAPGKTLVFDEVDAGIGGEVANVVARHLRTLSERFQVLVITHLPQIAAAASGHYRVSKIVESDRTLTQLLAVDGDLRAEEIARMMAGAARSEVVHRGALEILEAASGKAKGRKTKGETTKGGLF